MRPMLIASFAAVAGAATALADIYCPLFVEGSTLSWAGTTVDGVEDLHEPVLDSIEATTGEAVVVRIGRTELYFVPQEQP